MWKQIWQKNIKYWSIWKRRPDISQQTTLKMAKMLAVRCVEGEERVQICLKLDLENGNQRTFNFDRLKREDLQTTFVRMAANIGKATNKKNRNVKKRKNRNGPPVEGLGADPEPEEEPAIPVSISHNGEKVDESMSNGTAWVEGATFQVGESVFQVCVNLPNIKSMSLAENIMAGSPIYPKIDAEFMDFEQSQFTWHREKPQPVNEGGDSDLLEHGTVKKKQKQDPDVNVEWEPIHTGFYYIAKDEDLGRRLRVVCVPENGDKKGQEKQAVTKCEVTRGPGICPFENRHQFTQKRAEEGRYAVCFVRNISLS